MALEDRVERSGKAAGKRQPSQKWLTKGGLVRADSDDELGYEDLPWQWIYGDTIAKDQDVNETPSRKRKVSAFNESSKQRLLVGAKMGRFSVKIGDAVLLKSPEQGKDWAGLICAFSDTDEDGDEEKCAHIQWFCSPEELFFGRKFKVRTDILPNESYITADFNMNPLTSINGRAKVMSPESFFKKYPGGRPPRAKKAAMQYAKTILCRQGVKQRTLQYTDEFVWEEKYSGPEDLLPLIDWIRERTKGKRKRVINPDISQDAEFVQTKPPVTADEDPSTPRKKRKTTTSIATTPRSSAKTNKYTTPTHKRILIKKPIEITPLGTRVLSPSALLASPYAHARTTLHVSAVPPTLPCRDTEFSAVYSHLHSAITSGTGACIYISGTPGTGKTATVREVISALLASDLDPFNFVEINGLKLTHPTHAYSLLYECIHATQISATHALDLLSREFSTPSPRRVPTVVLMDELDQLVTRSQSVMYNFFNWPSLRHSRLIVLAVANTMDLPERTLSNKISSRLDLTRITFPGYTHTQLMEIISSRLAAVPGNIVETDAIQFAARKVAAVSGDARRALDICRRAVEIAENQSQSQSSPDADEIPGADTPTKTPRPPPTTTTTSTGRVTIATVKLAISEHTSSPLAVHLRTLPLAAKLFLAALLACTRRTGVNEATLGDILVEARRIADMDVSVSAETRGGGLKELLVSDSMRKGARVLGMGAAAQELGESGVVVLEGRGGRRGGGERSGKVRLRVGEEEVKWALRGDGECRGWGLDS